MTLQMKNNVFWSNFEMDSSEESADAYIPGLSKKGNRRPRVRCKKTSEIKAKIPIKQPQVETLTPRSKQMFTSLSSDDTIESRLNRQNKRLTGKVSLKDLCAEDKKRVANLIKELARVGDEKEKCLGQLKGERENFEQQVVQLVQQQEQVLQEREEVQQRLFQCHELLSKYQDQILEKEKKLNESLREQQLSPGLTQQLYHVPVRDGAHSPYIHRAMSPASSQGRSPRSAPNERRLSREEIRSKVERPVTSLIDKEIANHKSSDFPSTIIGDRSNYQREPGKTRLPKHFREPIMSSTQKSMEIHPFVSESHELIPLIPDTSPRSSGQGSRDQTPRNSKFDGHTKNKVGFKDKLESDENLQYSPNLHQSKIGDKEYMKYYKKLRPSDRKRELLKQREKLMEEQNRLQDILREQEDQLKHRQEQLIQKRIMQQERINSIVENYVEQDDGSVFNGRVDKLDFDKPLSEVDSEDIPNEAADMVQGRFPHHPVSSLPLPHTPPTAEKGTSFSRIQAHMPVTRDRADAGTSISRMEYPYRSDILNTPPKIDVGTGMSRVLLPSKTDNILNTPPKTDVGTSMSRVLIPSKPANLTTPTKNDVDNFINKMTEVTADFSAMSPSSSRQGNLPLPSNRGKSNTPLSAKVPGDKTLSVVDIVNSLDENFSSPQITGNYRSPITNSVKKLNSVERKSLHSPYSDKGRMSGQNSSRNQNIYKDDSTVEEQEEESHILEDIFFLK